MSSLDSCLPRPLFKPVSRKKGKGNKDPYHMGWDYVQNISSYKFKIESLPYATAEGAVNLAAMIDCLRGKDDSQVVFEISEKARAWGNALQLGQLIKGRWLTVNKFPLKFTRPAGCYAFPLWRDVINNRKQCHSVSDEVSNQVGLILDDLRYSSVDEVCYATKLVFNEALLNVFEHAYSSKEGRVVFGAITVTPVPRADQYGKLVNVADEEAAWFEEYTDRGLMLEVAVADYGQNVPST